MLPMEFFAKRSFAVTNVVSMAMYFGMFGSIFFLSQYMQNVLGNTPLQAGLKLLVWTGGDDGRRAAGRRLLASASAAARSWSPALSLQAVALGLARHRGLARTLSYGEHDRPVRPRPAPAWRSCSPPRRAPILTSVRVDQAGQASGATNAIREVGGVFGVAVLATVFTGAGAYTSPQAFVDGLVPALWVGVAVLAFGRARRAAAAVRPQRGARGRASRAASRRSPQRRRASRRGGRP